MDKNTLQQVDQLLMEQGSYTPLEFLLQQGRLIYSDYEQWRDGEIDNLVDVLFGDLDQIKQQLTEAEHYALQLGLTATSAQYQLWHSDHTADLQFSADTELNRCFYTHYAKAEDQPQFDMFMDAPAANLTKGIKLALVNRDINEARRQLDNLYTVSPDHTQLGDLERLVEVGENFDAPVDDVLLELETLQIEIVPLAELVLLQDSRNFVIPCWRRLSPALADRSFTAKQPTLHPSYTALAAQDWQQVKDAVENEPSWQKEAILITRHAQACTQLRLTQQALQSWFLLCWQTPDAAIEIAQLADTQIAGAWTQFQDLEPELIPQTFPAWLLLHKPGLRNLIDLDFFSSFAGQMHYLTFKSVYDLTGTFDKVKQPKIDIALRTQLKQYNPLLFQHFLNAN